jgi:hypothetical protein
VPINHAIETAIEYHAQFKDSKEVKPSDDIGKRRNNSTLSTIDCYMILTDDRPFEEMTDDDLDSIYAVAFGRWAYHLTRQGYIDALNKRRLDNKITLK